MNSFDILKEQLRESPLTWLVTGAAGFIGSHLVEQLVGLGQQVVGLDNFATGHRRNLDDVRASVGERGWERFRFIEGDIRDLEHCQAACRGVDIVLHQAALGSVPRSIANPIATNEANVDGFVNMLLAARDARVRRFVYAASSSTYGDHPDLPKVEDRIGRPLSPYAVTKLVNELYADVFQRTYGIQTVGLRYFNVFGPRQDPDGAYAAVIPRWIGALLAGQRCRVNGDGETSRDFCYVENVVQANLRAAIAGEESSGTVYNVAFGQRTSLRDLYRLIRDTLAEYRPEICELEPEYGAFRSGDVRHSLADIGKAKNLLGYAPTDSVHDGLRKTVAWFVHRESVPSGR